MAYSVSPRRTRAMSGGKNSEKRSTRMPTALAAVKWPASWRITSAAKPRKASSQLTRWLRVRAPAPSAMTSAGARSCADRRLDELAGPRPGLGVGHVERLEVVHRRRAQRVEDALDDRGDAEERQAALQERVHGHLVGGVQRAGGRPAGRRGLAGQ